MNIVGIIPARGGSKGLSDKNILNLGGKPVIGHSIEAALKSKCLNKVVVSTDSIKIANIVKNLYSIDVIMRPPEFAQEDSPIEQSLLHIVEYLQKNQNFTTDIVVWLQANVPFRKEGIVDKIIEKLIDFNADSCVTCYEVKEFPEVMQVIASDGTLKPFYQDVTAIRRQEFPKRYLLDGSVLALRAKNLFETRGIRKTHVYLGKKILPVIQEETFYSLEIDSRYDLLLAEFYIQKGFINPQ